MEKSKDKRQLIDFPLGSKAVLWVSDLNRYIIAEPLAIQIIQSLHKGSSSERVASELKNEAGISESELLGLIAQIKQAWDENIDSIQENQSRINESLPTRLSAFSVKKYAINGQIFDVVYESAYTEWINHPKFAHLETHEKSKVDYHFWVGDSDGRLSIWVNGVYSGRWKQEENHFLSGRFSMKIIEKIYAKEEHDWMGVFHAAGISNGKQCIMFFGESGNGKSTLSALAMASGFDILSDDFLPVDSKTGLVYHFPAALSIKKNAYDLVKHFYPELMDGYEYENPAFGKVYRFLAPSREIKEAVPCKAIIEVKYDPDVSFALENLPEEEAFAKLVTDSWINQSPGNAKNFIEWFRSRQHYRLRYSDNDQMIAALKSLLDEER